ncbi:MAG: helix-turn-helix domain-containing protein, partial [Planctomycetota bacterium]
AALLASRRDEYRRQRDRAEAIEEFKLTDYAGVRWMYLQEEASLMAAIRRGDRPSAREILNRLLVAMIHRAGGEPAPLEVVKSFFVELVVMMCRTAVEAGNAPEELFGPDYVRLARVARARTEQDLSAWLRETLEGIMDAIGRAEAPPASQVITAALQHMRRHLDEPLSRDDVARAAHVSGPHFSRVFHRQTGRTFTQVLSRMRLDRAAWLLARTDKPIAAVALESGFADQSHFTKVFRRRFHETPRSYRRRLRPAPGES